MFAIHLSNFRPISRYYARRGARLAYSYNGKLIGTRIYYIKWCYFQRSDSNACHVHLYFFAFLRCLFTFATCRDRELKFGTLVDNNKS